MKISIITPNYNGDQYLEQCLRSVIDQQLNGELQFIVMDGGSTDQSHSILEGYREHISELIIEPDTGPANAINKGFAIADGDIIAWLNADDIYFPGTLQRVLDAFQTYPESCMFFGHCPVIDEQNDEIRKPITRFKECFFPFSSRFTFQCINYISQPATFFRRTAVEAAGPLREELTAAFDYEFFLRLFDSGPVKQIKGPPLAAFRWHPGSISGRSFHQQFKEEYEAAVVRCGKWSPQAVLHGCVRWGIVTAYTCMQHMYRTSS